MSGMLQRRKARSTGTLVEVWRTADFGLDPDDGGPWLTVCEHGNNVQHQTRQVALSWAAEPEMWCETGCRHQAEGRHCPGCNSTRMDFHGDFWHCGDCGDEWTCNCPETE